MELNLIKTTLADLPSNARCIQDLKNTPFFFIRLSTKSVDRSFINKHIRKAEKSSDFLDFSNGKVAKRAEITCGVAVAG